MRVQLAMHEKAQSVDGSAKRQADRRIILLVGAARSGKTRLATTLNTHRGVTYCYEPFCKPCQEEIDLLVHKMNRNLLTSEEKSVLIRKLSTSYSAWRRPPFFLKGTPAGSPIGGWFDA